MAEKELILVLIKPDGLTHSLTGDILTQLTDPSLEIAAAKVVSVDRRLAEAHYWQHEGKPYFENTLRYLMGEFHDNHRVLALAYVGVDAISTIRRKMGPTDPLVAKHGAQTRTSIRAKFGSLEPIKNEDGSYLMMNNQAVFLFFNLVHGSDAPSTAEYEIKLWFRPEEIAEVHRVEVAVPGSPYEVEERTVREYDGDGHLVNEYTRLAWKKSAEEVRRELASRGA